MPADKDQTQDKIDFESAVIAASGTKTAAVDLRGMTLVGFYLPATFTGTAVTFEASADNSTFISVRDGAGNALSKTVAQNQFIPLDPALFLGIQYLKLVSGSTEGAERTIKLALRQR